MDSADLFEVTILIGSAFLVNYITADAKTNWAEGAVMIAFYLMIVRRLVTRSLLHYSCLPHFFLAATKAVAAWFYTGQPEIKIMAVCNESVAAALASGELPAGQ